jgi:hypothetical protein
MNLMVPLLQQLSLQNQAFSKQGVLEHLVAGRTPGMPRAVVRDGVAYFPWDAARGSA